MEERKRLRHGELRGEAGGSLPRGEDWDSRCMGADVF